MTAEWTPDPACLLDAAFVLPHRLNQNGEQCPQMKQLGAWEPRAAPHSDLSGSFSTDFDILPDARFRPLPQGARRASARIRGVAMGGGPARLFPQFFAPLPTGVGVLIARPDDRAEWYPVDDQFS